MSENQGSKLSGYELEQAYEEMLDECYPVVTIGFGQYYASDILKHCDPVVYRIGLSEFEDELDEELDEEE